jgi:hypothetical protein
MFTPTERFAMKTKVFTSLAVFAALMAVVPASRSQTGAQKPSSSAKAAAVTKAAPPARTEEASRQEKAAKTLSATQKKMDETAKTVTGNLK